MCIVFYTLTQPGYKLDEYLDRPTLPAKWHTFAPLPQTPLSSQDDSEDGWVLSGRDNGSPTGGTWLGLTRDLRIAVLTNIRIPPVPIPPNAPSRGTLVKDFLAPEANDTHSSVHEYLEGHYGGMDGYEGFNLLLFRLHPKRSTLLPDSRPSEGDNAVDWEETEVGYLSNRPTPTLRDIHASSSYANPDNTTGGRGCHGMSNTPLDQPWPKVLQGEEDMTKTLKEWREKDEDEDSLIERLMVMLQRTKPLDSIADLSECTCLHPVSIGQNPSEKIRADEKGRWYGTRVTTVILVREDGQVTFVERDIFVQNSSGDAVSGTEERKYRFEAEIAG